jgi:transcriptional regulator with XRE-family HTH domain
MDAEKGSLIAIKKGCSAVKKDARCLFGNMEIERERQKMSIEYVAEILGVSASIYEGWLEGRTEIPCTAIAKLARLWGVSSDYLLGLSDRR